MLREMGVPAFWPEAQPDMPVAETPPARPAVPIAQTTSGALEVVGSRPALPVPPPVASLPAAASASRAAPSADEVSLGTRPSGVEAMDWPALRAAVSVCQACALSQSRTQTVFGIGHIEADWMIVGEAPGEQEDKQGEPFVGRAGELLDRMLEAVGLTRAEAPASQQVFIANVLKCRPPANRNPLPQEVAQCEPYLLRQMALVQPRVVLAMGRFAVQSLLKSSEPLGKLRGRVHQVQGVPVIVTYHPAYLLRSPADKALAWDDLCLAREVLAQARAHAH